MREVKNLIKIASPCFNENMECMNQCLHVVKYVQHSLYESTKTKDNDARKNDASIMDHSGFDYKFDTTNEDEKIGCYLHQ